MSANVAGIVGGQLFRSDDLPFYHRGWTIAVAFMAFGVACVIAQIGLYAFANTRVRQGAASKANGTTAEKSAQGSSDEAEIKLYNY